MTGWEGWGRWRKVIDGNKSPAQPRQPKYTASKAKCNNSFFPAYFSYLIIFLLVGIVNIFA